MSEPTSPPSASPISSEVTTASTELEPVEVSGGMTNSPDSISELFSREPDSWTEDDMTRLVVELRKRRVQLDATPEKKPKAEKAPPREDLKGLTGAALLLKLGMKKDAAS